MGLLPDTKSCALRMRRECRERFLRHRRKQLVNDPGMHHGTCVTHVPWCMSGSLTCCGGENVPGIPGACAARSFTYLARGPCYVHVICRKNTFFKLLSLSILLFIQTSLGMSSKKITTHSTTLRQIYSAHSAQVFEFETLLLVLLWLHYIEIRWLYECCATNYNSTSIMTIRLCGCVTFYCKYHGWKLSISCW